MLRDLTRTVLAIGVSVLAAAAHATQTSVPFIHADSVHAQGITGRGVTVAVLDWGVDYAHPGLAGSIAPGGTSFVLGWEVHDSGAAASGQSHGTLVSLVITDPTGVAPDAMILPIRIWTNYFPLPTRGDTVKAIKRVRDRRHVDPTIRVIDLSFGGGFYTCACDNEDADQASEILGAALDGIVTFAASGNAGGCTGVPAPACVSCAIPVVAIYDDSDPGFVLYPECVDEWGVPGLVTCFSQISESCDMLAAPGHDISVGGFEHWWGASFATPHAAGVAALMFSKIGCGSMSYDTARAMIFDNGDSAIPQVGCPLVPVTQVNALKAVDHVTELQCGSSYDMNCDGYIDFSDVVMIVDCLLGPAAPPPTDICKCAQSLPPLRGTGGVDLRDFAQFQLAFTGYGSGACCQPHGECSVTTVKDCADEFGATYQGHGTTCDGVQCDPGDWGACCHPDTHTCTESTREDCIWGAPGIGDEGLYLGDGTRCATAPCPTLRYRNVIDPPTTIVPCGEGLQLADDITLEGSEPTGLAYYDLAVHGGSTDFFDVTVGLYTECPGFGGTLIEGTERTFADNPNYGAPVFLTATFDPPVYIPNHFWMVVTFSDPSCGWFVAERAEVGYTFDVFARNDGTVDDPLWVCNYWWGDRLHVESPADVGGEGESGKAWIVC